MASTRKLFVEIVEARNLVACEKNGTSEPYAIVYLSDDQNGAAEIKGERFKTKSKSRTLNPKWGIKHTFGEHSRDLDVENVNIVLVVRLFHRVTFGSDLPMGKAIIPIDVNRETSIDDWWPLIIDGRMRDVTGEVHLKLRLTSPLSGSNADGSMLSTMTSNEPFFAITLPPDEPIDFSHEPPNELHIVVIRGRNLLAADKNLFASDSSDPWVKIRLSDFPVERTKVIPKSLNPVWNENFVYKGVIDPSLAIELVVEDKDFVKNDFLGKVILSLKHYENKKITRKWFRLGNAYGLSDHVKRGDLEIGLRWIFSPSVADDLRKKAQNRGFLSKMLSHATEEDETVDDDDDSDTEALIPEMDAEMSKKQAAELAMINESLEKEIGAFEIKSGDYQIQVHIIEARDLKAEDLSGLSDPVVYVECFGQKFNTPVAPQCLSCVFDEVFIFNLRNLDKDEFEDGIIKITCMNANTVRKNDMIGSYSMDASYVYFQQDHEVYRTWVALIDDEDVSDMGVQGYLKISIQIVGPGDKMKVHDEEEETKKEAAREAASGGDMGGMVMMPPTVKKTWSYLVTAVYRAEHLPVMNRSLGVLETSGTDAFIQVSFAGGNPLRSKSKHMLGNRLAMNPIFNDELWYAICLPSMTQNIALTVWDREIAMPTHNLIATTGTKLDLLQRVKRLGPIWLNLYGAPESVAISMKELTANTLKAVGKTLDYSIDYKKQYNNYPDKASTYKGRILISQRIAKEAPPKFKSDDYPSFRRKVRALTGTEEPPTTGYFLRAVVVSGEELPMFTNFSVGTHMGQSHKLMVRVSVGMTELCSNKKDCKKGLCEWCEDLVSDEMEWPADITQVPDIFVHLVKGVGKDAHAVCFARFKAADLLKERFNGTCQWIQLQKDRVFNELDENDFPGAILMKLGFGEKHDFVRTDNEWKAVMARLKERKPYQLRVHVYQARNIVAADNNGQSDPYLKVKVAGEEQLTDVKKKTLYPLYYKTLCYNLMLPNVEFAPQVCIQLFDKDNLDSDDYLGCCQVNMSSAFTLPNLNSPLPDPVWHDFFFEKRGDSQGSLLLSLQLIPLVSLDAELPPPADITPKRKPAFMEIIILGIRDMSPYNFVAMQCPSLDIELNCFGVNNKVSTEKSKRPNPSNPNFLQRLVMPVSLPDNALFATPLTLSAKDNRFGSFKVPTVGVGIVEMTDKIPWSSSYKAPQTMVFRQDTPDIDGLMEEKEKSVVDEDEEDALLQDTTKDALQLKAERDLQGRKDRQQVDNYLLTLDPKEVEDLVKAKIPEEDNGAGVFGALAHINLNGKKKKKTAEDMFEDVDWQSEGEEEEPKYLKNRVKLPSEIEEYFKTTPFETFKLYRGKSNGMFGSTLKVVGRVKGLIRVMMHADDPPLFDLGQLLKPQSYVVRLYILRAINLTPMDAGFGGRPGKSDPYLKVQLGKQFFNDRQNTVDDVTDVDLYKMIELPCELPGTSQLTIDIMDKDVIGSDDLIGRTVIDLEDRWFDLRWQDWGKENRYPQGNEVVDDSGLKRWDTKPLERRSLYILSNNNPQGTLECWVDILTPAEANAFEPDDVALPPTQLFEMRVVIWKTKDVVSMDNMGGMNDLFVKVWPEGCSPQNTDTHWRCKKGKGSFNWRLLFDVELGHNTKSMKFPYLHIQMWDKDVLKWNDCIAEGMLDMGKYYRKAYKHNLAIKLFEDKKGAAKTREKKIASGELDDEGTDALDDPRRYIPPEEVNGDEDDDETKASMNPLLNSSSMLTSPPAAIRQRNNSNNNNHSTTGNDDIVVGSFVSEEEKKESESKSKNNTKDVSSGAGKKPTTSTTDNSKIQKKKKSWWKFWISEEKKNKVPQKTKGQTEENETKEQSNGKGKKKGEDDDEEMADFITTIKNMTGLWDSDPPDSYWLHMDRLDHNTGVRVPMGKLCLSIQIWPKDKAVVMPAGAGRSDPNTDPFLPPPVGRFKFSLNPFVLGSELCGPAMCAKLFCCLICAGVLALMVFCQPAINFVILLLFQLLGH